MKNPGIIVTLADGRRGIIYQAALHKGGYPIGKVPVEVEKDGKTVKLLCSASKVTQIGFVD